MDFEIAEIQKILSEWDPQGDQKSRISDLNKYEIEAMDIAASLQVFAHDKKSTINLVRQTINQAFQLSLTRDEAVEAGNKVWQVFQRHN